MLVAGIPPTTQRRIMIDGPATERFRHRMKQVRIARGLTQAAVADAAHIHRPTLSKMEGGAQGFTLDNALAIANALGYPLSVFLDDGPLTIQRDDVTVA